jgi:hypothetical protein
MSGSTRVGFEGGTTNRKFPIESEQRIILALVCKHALVGSIQFQFDPLRQIHLQPIFQVNRISSVLWGDEENSMRVYFNHCSPGGFQSTAHFGQDSVRLGRNGLDQVVVVEKCLRGTQIPIKGIALGNSSSYPKAPCSLAGLLSALGRRLPYHGMTNSCSGCFTVNTGQGAIRTTFSAVLPISMWANPVRP